MKTSILVGFLFLIGISFNAAAQNQTPTIGESTSTTATRGSAETERSLKRSGLPGQTSPTPPIEDRRPTGDPDPKKLRPDSLRRGGATKVDTVRRQ